MPRLFPTTETKFPKNILSAALLLATALVVVLGLQGRATRSDVRETESQLLLARERANALFPNLYAPTLKAESLEGDSVTLGTADAVAQVYFVYNTRCPYCSRVRMASNANAAALVIMESVLPKTGALERSWVVISDHSPT